MYIIYIYTQYLKDSQGREICGPFGPTKTDLFGAEI